MLRLRPAPLLGGLALMAGCASGPVLPTKDLGVNRVFATVKGVT